MAKKGQANILARAVVKGLNHSTRCLLWLSTSSVGRLMALIKGSLSRQWVTISFTVSISSCRVLHKLSNAIDHSTVPLIPSHSDLPWLMAKRDHEASILKLFICMHKLRKCLQFFYCASQPSEKYSIFFTYSCFIFKYFTNFNCNVYEFWHHAANHQKESRSSSCTSCFLCLYNSIVQSEQCSCYVTNGNFTLFW